MLRKLVLYSDQVIPENARVDRRLIALIGKEHPTIGYIPSASDPDRVWFGQKRAYYEALDARLEPYFEIDVAYEPEKLSSLLTCDAIHLSGGNTYHFLYWLRARQLMKPLQDYVADGGVLIGTSAGAILMTPEITTASLCGDTPPNTLSDFSGLGLVDFAFLPHINHIESAARVLQDYSLQARCTVYGCPDGDGLIVQGEQIECVGSLLRAANGKLLQD